MDIANTLTAVLVKALIAAAVLTPPIASGLIALYRRAVIRLMSKRAQSASAGAPPPETPNALFLPPAGKAELVSVGTATSAENPLTTKLFRSLRLRPWQAAAVYILGGVCFAIIMTISRILSTNLEISPWRFLALAPIFLWPSVIVVNIVASPNLRSSVIAILAYILLFTIASAVSIALSPLVDWIQMIGLWVIHNLPATILVLAFLYQRIRAVGPMVFTFVTFSILGIADVSIYGGKALIDHAIREPGLVRFFIDGLFELGISPYFGIFTIFTILGFLIMAGIGWFVLQLLKGLHLRKRQSGQALILDPIWLMFGFAVSAMMATGNPWFLLSMFFAFGAYKIVTWAGFGLLNRKRRKVKGPKLLLLRVFSLGRRSEQLYRAIAKAWRYAGNIRFITGPDLATSTVEPHNFLDYISGRLCHHFIDSAETLERRIETADVLPGLDGRYRIHDFFCYDDTWKMVLSRLAKDSDVILMDLRKFSRSNAGCVFEINELVNHVPLKKVVFVIDKTTDEAFLHESIENTRERLSVDSPNREKCPKLQLFHYDERRPGGYHQLLYALSVATTSS